MVPVLMGLRVQSRNRAYSITTQGLEHCHCVQCCREEALALRGLSRDLRRSGRSGETSLKAKFWDRDLQDELES